MAFYAPVGKPQPWMTIVTDIDGPLHVQCQAQMRRVPDDSGRYACSRCLRTGYLLEEFPR